MYVGDMLSVQKESVIFDYQDEKDFFGDAGLDYDELEMMDPAQRRIILKNAGLDPQEFAF